MIHRISTGCGAAHLTPGTKNAKNLLMLTAHPETPVAAGTSAPLIYSNQFPNLNLPDET